MSMTTQEVVGMPSTKDGFTLVEIMVALTILIFGIIFAVSLGTEASKLNRITTKGLAAQSAASQIYELLNSVSYTDTLLSDDGDVTDLNNIADPDHHRNVLVGFKTYPVIWNVADNRLMNDIKPGYKTVVIKVLNPDKTSQVLYSITLIKGAGT